MGANRILLNDGQRRRFAVKGKVLGRRRLEEVGTFFTPDSILQWHRRLVAAKHVYSDRRKKAGRPVLADDIVRLYNPFYPKEKLIHLSGVTLRVQQLRKSSGPLTGLTL